jgi:hypothetical protein
VQKESRPFWRHVVEDGVQLTILLILISLAITACKGTPQPDLSPLQAQATGLPEVPGALGYFGFSFQYGERMTGTVMITQTLISQNEIMATRIYTVPMEVTNTLTDTVSSALHIIEPWPVHLTEDATEYAQALFRFEGIDGEDEIVGVWHTDYTTPQDPNNDGLYLIRTVTVHKLFFPIVLQ